MSVDANGVLQSSFAEAAYSGSSSSVHGAGLSADGAFFYSADGESLLIPLTRVLMLRLDGLRGSKHPGYQTSDLKCL